MLPANERRRTTRTIKLALHCLQQLGFDENSQPCAAVFASCSGDMDLVQSICQSLSHNNKAVSPTQFHNSVHNAAAGYWSIGKKWMQETTSISAASGTFVAGFLETYSKIVERNEAVILCGYDITSPQPLKEKRPIEYDFGCSLLLSSVKSNQSLAKLSFDFTNDTGVTTMQDSLLETLRTDNPTAASLPLLQAVASRSKADMVIPYLSELNLQIQVVPI